MGMFDNLRCKYPLPVDGANALEYQTKDTPAQYLELYEIREDGTLWHELYDTEDHSERGKWIAANPNKPEEDAPQGISALLGCMARVNQRWEQLPDFTGEVCFHDYDERSKLIGLRILRPGKLRV